MTRIWRWRYIVDWRLQGSLIVHGLLYGTLVLVAVSFGIFTPLLWDLGGVELDEAMQERAIVMLYLHERFWMLTAVCLLIVVVGAIKFSHRVAGPMVRFKRNLRLLADGKMTPPLQTRRADYMKDEVACLNAAVEGVAHRVDAIRHAQIAVRRELTAIIDRAPERREEVASLLTACDQLEECVREFRHVDPGDVRTLTEPQSVDADVALAPSGGA